MSLVPGAYDKNPMATATGTKPVAISSNIFSGRRRLSPHPGC